MINWNVTPILFPNGIPYILFSEMEWIGKLSYIATDLDTRITTIETETIPAITDRLDTLENTTIPAITDRIDTIENTTIPAIQNDIADINSRTQILLVYPVVSYPVDTTDTRSYEITLPTGYNISDLSFVLTGDYTDDFGITSKSTHNFTINNASGEYHKSYFAYAELTGEYGSPLYIANDISVTTNNNTITITFGKEFLFDDTNLTTKTDFYGLPVISNVVAKLYKLPTT